MLFIFSPLLTKLKGPLGLQSVSWSLRSDMKSRFSLDFKQHHSCNRFDYLHLLYFHKWVLNCLSNCQSGKSIFHTFLCPCCRGGGSKFYPCPSVCPSQSWFPFSNFSLPQPNAMKLIHNAYYHKIQIKFEFWWCHFNRSRVMPLYKWKTC